MQPIALTCLLFSALFLFLEIAPTEAFLPAKVSVGRKLAMSMSLSNTVRIRGGAGAVLEATSVSQINDIIASAGPKKLIVVDFSASWCMPCKMIAPVFTKMASDPQNADVIFVKVDVDAAPDVAQKYSVAAMPTFVFLKNGAELERFSGANADRIAKSVATHKH